MSILIHTSTEIGYFCASMYFCISSGYLIIIAQYLSNYRVLALILF